MRTLTTDILYWDGPHFNSCSLDRAQPLNTSGNGPDSMSVTLQSLEALERHSRGSCHELQESGPPLLIKGLHCLPEPSDDVAVGHTMLQARVRLPVIQVYFIQPAYYQLGKGVRLEVKSEPSTSLALPQESSYSRSTGSAAPSGLKPQNLRAEFALDQGRADRVGTRQAMCR